MITIVLIHPGSTLFDIEQRIQGNLSVPLNPMGKEQNLVLADQLKDLHFTAIYAPETEPDWETAQFLASQWKVPAVAVNCMKNVNMGLWQGMETDELHKCQPTVFKQGKEDPFSVSAPAGESLQDAQARVTQAIKKIAKKWDDNTAVGIVVSDPMAGLIRFVLNKKQGEYPDLWNLSDSQGKWESVSVAKEELSKL